MVPIYLLLFCMSAYLGAISSHMPRKIWIVSSSFAEAEDMMLWKIQQLRRTGNSNDLGGYSEVLEVVSIFDVCEWKPIPNIYEQMRVYARSPVTCSLYRLCGDSWNSVINGNKAVIDFLYNIVLDHQDALANFVRGYNPHWSSANQISCITL